MSVSQQEEWELRERDVIVTALGARNAIDLAAKSFAFSREIRRLQPQAILCWMYHANLFGSLSAGISRYRVPVFWNIRHSLDDFNSESFSTKVAILGNRLLSRWADGIVFCSQRSRDQHIKFGFFSERAIFIPNGYDFTACVERKGSLPSGRQFPNIIVGAAGRFHVAKDYPTLLAAAATVLQRFPSVEFVIAGKGVSLNNPTFSALVRRSGVDITRLRLLGEIADMEAFYSSIDVFVLSSITEGFPNVLAEAMAHGVPCVTTDVGDAAYIVDSHGKVVQPRFPDRLAEAIIEMLSMPDDERAAMGQRARESVLNRFDIRRVVQLYIEFLGGDAETV